MAGGAPVHYCGGNLPALAGTTDFQDALSGMAQFQPVTRAYIFGGTGNILTANRLANIALNGTIVYPIAPLATINQSIPNAAPAPHNSFAPVSQTATMVHARYDAASARLASGRFLIAGGGNGNTFLASTELYNPSTNSFLNPNPATLTTARANETATLLPNGKVLIAGGRDASGTPLASTELYDPSTNSVAAGPFMVVARTYARATLLPNGKVLIAGGLGNSSTVLKSTELYNPATNTFLVPDPAVMKVARYFATAVLLPNGKVLIAGGYGGVGDDTLSSTELYQPSSNSFAASGTAAMTASRGLASAALLPNGKVIIAGGTSSNGSTIVNTTDLYTP
jgi:hypothetical protein